MATDRIPKCLNGHGKMMLVKEDKDVKIRDVEFIVRDVEFYKCKTCNLEVGTPRQTGDIQKKILEGYEEITGEKIELRKLSDNIH